MDVVDDAALLLELVFDRVLPGIPEDLNAAGAMLVVLRCSNQSHTIFSTEGSRSHSAQHPSLHEPGPKTWMRWNNLGIALLDQFQYEQAVAAFTEVIKLRYRYVDAYTNIGLTEIAWEKYGSARTAIQRALSLDPNNARALYYDGHLQRRMRPQA